VQGRPRGKSLVFPEGEYVFGRGAECHIQPNSEWVSRQHCLLRVGPKGAFIRDLNSRNGTLVNGKRVLEELRLVHGDQVQVGPLVFEVRLDTLKPPSSANAAVLRDSSADLTLAEVVETVEQPSLNEPNGKTTSELDAQGLNPTVFPPAQKR